MGKVTDRLLNAGSLESEKTSMSKVPLDSVMTELGDPKEQAPAAFMTLVKAAYTDKPETAIPLFARARFPDMPIEEAVKRYGVNKGKVVWRSANGKIYEENPDTFWGIVKSGGAQALTPTGLLALALGAITGGAGAIPMAALGAAGGEGYRQAIGSEVFGEERTTGEAIAGMGKEAILAAAGEGGGKALGGAIKKGLSLNKPGGRLLANEIERAGANVNDIGVSDVAKMRSIGAQYGMDELPATVLTGSDELAQVTTLLGKSPRTARLFQRARKDLTDKTEKAVYRFLDDIALDTDAFEVGNRVVGAAERSIEDMVTKRTMAVQPIYERAFSVANPVDTRRVLRDMDLLTRSLPEGKSTAGNALNRIKRNLYKTVEETGPDGQTVERLVPQDDLAVLDTVKKEIDQLLEGPEAPNIQKDALRRLSIIKDSLVKSMKESTPGGEYGSALAEYQRLSPPIEAAQRGITGNIAKKEGDRIVGAANQLFSSVDSTPATVARAKQLIQSQDPEAWDQAVRGYLQGKFETIRTGVSGDVNLGGNFQKEIFGSEKQRKILRTALSTQQYSALVDFTELLKNTSLMFKSASDTTPFRITQKAIDKAGGSKLLEVAGEPWLAPKHLIFDRINDFLKGAYNEKLARAILSEEGARELAAIRRLNPRSRQAMEAFGAFFGAIAGLEGPRRLTLAAGTDRLPAPLQTGGQTQ